MKIELNTDDCWKVIEAGLFVLGYTETTGSCGASVQILEGKRLKIIIPDAKKVPKPEKYIEKKGVDLVNGYATGQWKEGEING